MGWNEKTINTYDESAEALAEYFRGIGPRVSDIELGLKLAGVTDKAGRVIEVGCGDGRDAKEIISKVSWYEGFDPSTGLLDIARKTNPDDSFVLADALSYDYPENIDVIYAFASLLHLNKDDLRSAISKAAKSLKVGGIYFISLKERPEYTEEVKSDKYGERMFYYYNAKIVKKIVSSQLEVVHEAQQQIGSTSWFTIALKRL